MLLGGMAYDPDREEHFYRLFKHSLDHLTHLTDMSVRREEEFSRRIDKLIEAINDKNMAGGTADWKSLLVIFAFFGTMWLHLSLKVDGVEETIREISMSVSRIEGGLGVTRSPPEPAAAPAAISPP